MADARLSYSGNAVDMVAGAVSMSEAENRAIAAHFVEAKPGDGQQLVSPFFKIDGRTSGIVQVTNMSASPVKAGASMKFANSSLQPLTTDLITVPAGGTATLDLKPYLNAVPDGVSAKGYVQLVHNGTPGQVCASFTAIGTGSTIGQECPFEGGPAFPAGGMVVFPNTTTTEPGDPITVGVVTDGTGGTPVFSTSGGTITPQPSPDPGVFSALFDPPDDGTDTVTITVASASGSSSSTITIQKVKLVGFETLDSTGNVRRRPDGTVLTRLNPDGGTRFRITSNKVFPEGTLRVVFKGIESGSDVFVDNPSRPAQNQLEALAPPNDKFLKEAQIIVQLQQADGSFKKISKDKTGSAYYAYDPPDPQMTITPNSLNRDGGDVTLTGNGFKEFRSSLQGVPAEEPDVDIAGEIGVKNVSVISLTQISGKVKNAPLDVLACDPDSTAPPCKRVRVLNPGGNDKDRVKTVPIFKLLPGPAPVFASIDPPSGPEGGTTEVTIEGLNFFVVSQVRIGLANAPITGRGFDSKTTKDFVKITAPSVCPPGAKAVELLDVDLRFITPAGTFTYLTKQITVDKNHTEFNFPLLAFDPYTDDVDVFVGPCETVTASPTSFSFGTGNCGSGTVAVTPKASKTNPTQNAFNVQIHIIPGSCAAGTTASQIITVTSSSQGGGPTQQVQLTVNVRIP